MKTEKLKRDEKINCILFLLCLQVMRDERITQAGKYEDILKTTFMELVGAHEKALSVLDTSEVGPSSEKMNINEEDTDMESTKKEMLKQEEHGDGQTSKRDDIVSSKGQLIQKEREKGKFGFVVGNFLQRLMGERL